jgi:dipeptidyl aminopeptidase/acylaminoacyl peptidase
MKLVLFTDGKTDYRVIGEGFLTGDGHPSFAPDGDRIAVDRNDGSRVEKQLLLFSVKTGQGRRLATFPMKEKRFLSGDLRCDLHPRWNREGREICVDALDTATWTRQLHVVEL